MKKIFLSMLLLSTSLLANTALHHEGEHLGSANHSGTGKVYHDGDFIEFNLSFEAACYADRANSWDYVAQNVSTFLDWLNNERDVAGENLAWDVEPLNLWRNDNYYNGGELCSGTYSASQAIKLVLNKSEGTSSLHVDAIQDFYARLQATIWPLSHAESGDLPSRVGTTITSIEKGIYEETADTLRINAKAKAQGKATKDFLAFLGEGYNGTWYLQSVDFRENDYGSYYKAGVEMAAPLPPAAGGGGVYLPEPAQLKLKPLSLSITGNFHFVFDVTYNDNN